MIEALIYAASDAPDNSLFWLLVFYWVAISLKYIYIHDSSKLSPKCKKKEQLHIIF